MWGARVFIIVFVAASFLQRPLLLLAQISGIAELDVFRRTYNFLFSPFIGRLLARIGGFIKFEVGYQLCTIVIRLRHLLAFPLLRWVAGILHDIQVKLLRFVAFLIRVVLQFLQQFQIPSFGAIRHNLLIWILLFDIFLIHLAPITMFSLLLAHIGYHCLELWCILALFQSLLPSILVLSSLWVLLALWAQRKIRNTFLFHRRNLVLRFNWPDHRWALALVKL